VLSRYPFDPATVKPSEEMALKEARERVNAIKSS